MDDYVTFLLQHQRCLSQTFDHQLPQWRWSGWMISYVYCINKPNRVRIFCKYEVKIAAKSCLEINKRCVWLGIQASLPSLRPPNKSDPISCCRGSTWLVVCHLREWGQEEFAGQQETVPSCMPNIVHCNVWTTFLITSVLNPQFFFYSWTCRSSFSLLWLLK